MRYYYDAVLTCCAKQQLKLLFGSLVKSWLWEWVNIVDIVILILAITLAILQYLSK